jgi:hypothetical protein
MVRHIVLIKWKPETNAEQIQAFADGFASLRESISVVRGMYYGPDLGLMDGTFDYAMVADFDSAEDWHTYRDHPDHIAFAQRFGHLGADTARVQFSLEPVNPSSESLMPWITR